MKNKVYNKVIKATAVAMAVPSYAVTKTAKAIVYGITENETARGLVDWWEVGGDLFMMGALNIGKEL